LVDVPRARFNFRGGSPEATRRPSDRFDQELESSLVATIALAQRRSGPPRALVDLGREQPIEASDRRPDHHERRNISFRWLTGAVLTGLCGVALVGSALYLDLDRQSNFAEAPELATPSRHENPEEARVNPGKGDRLVRPVDIVAAKQTFRAATTIKVGDKEVVKPRAFTHVATTLTMIATGFASDVPEFNPLKLTAGATEEPDQPTDTGVVQDDAEVAFKTRDLMTADAILVADGLSAAEAQAQVAESMRAFSVAKNALPIPPQLLLMRTSRAGLDPVGGLAYAAAGTVGPTAPFASIDVRMVPENVTNAPRSPSSEEAEAKERLVVLRHGESFGDLLATNGATKPDVDKIVTAFGAKKGEGPIAEGQKALLTFAEADGAAPRKIARISVYADEQLKATVAADDAGDYVAVTLPAAPPAAKKANDEDSGGLSLYESFYQSALKQGIPKPIIEELVKAFANDVDFQRSVTAGDSVEAFYSEPDEIEVHPELLFGTITARDQVFKYYRFQTPDDGRVDYYDENGRSVRKFLIRKPLVAGEMTSPFGMRFHPIMHYTRMHTGVDWANAVGTPILAAGNGTVIKAGGEQGYGRRVEIQHANGYVTTYSHMSGFARGIVEGAHVNQGQVIGYIGQSGMATGPHLHYEVIVNGRFVDPMGIKLARTREFDGKMLAAFKRERDRIDQLVGQAPNATSIAQAPSAAPSLTPVAQRVN
jgi:murein DD-endopeptidase MepM/ murein hydrolase activator NlpD